MNQLEYLTKSAQLGTLSHAYILSGNDREGKEKAIFAFCEFLLGRGLPDRQAGQNLGDLHVIEAQGKEISINQIRELRFSLALGAWNSPWKIALVKNCHRMNQEAQSAFLKLLEEPKGATVFLLETDRVFQLLATIRSRAQEIRFWKFPSEAERVSENVGREISSLFTQSLYKRFALAKTLSESPEEVQQFLEQFMGYVRSLLFASLKEGNELSSLSLLKRAQETSSLLQTTNASSRLAIEGLFGSM